MPNTLKPIQAYARMTETLFPSFLTINTAGMTTGTARDAKIINSSTGGTAPLTIPLTARDASGTNPKRIQIHPRSFREKTGSRVNNATTEAVPNANITNMLRAASSTVRNVSASFSSLVDSLAELREDVLDVRFRTSTGVLLAFFAAKTSEHAAITISAHNAGRTKNTMLKTPFESNLTCELHPSKLGKRSGYFLSQGNSEVDMPPPECYIHYPLVVRWKRKDGARVKVAVGISGGVDSAVAAFLLKRAGHDVTGTTMSIWDGSIPIPDNAPPPKNACFGHDEAEEIAAAEKICDTIGIPFKLVDCAAEYAENILEYFKNEYLAGRTPNPCVMCNQKIKFGLLPEALEASGIEFDKFATGHYCRIEQTEDGAFLLKKGRDHKKDQSYFLHRLKQEQLAKILFPLGEMTKNEVRKTAEDAELPVPIDTESQDFYSGDYSDLIPEKPRQGDFVDNAGIVLGHHRGYWNYTVGQRRGLGVSHTKPLYVVSIDPARNQVLLGEAEALEVRGLRAYDVNFIVPLPRRDGLEAKIRSAANPAPCSVTEINADSFEIAFEENISAVAPGQSCVLYDGDTVIGGGIIEKAI